MSGVAIVRALLIADTSLTAIVDADNVFPIDVPQRATLPAIAINSISMTSYRTLAMNESDRMFMERIQINAYTKTSASTPAGDGYPALREIMAAIFTACQNQRGTFGAFVLDSILPEFSGPDFISEDTGILSASHDFMVKWKNA